MHKGGLLLPRSHVKLHIAASKQLQSICREPFKRRSSAQDYSLNITGCSTQQAHLKQSLSKHHPISRSRNFSSTTTKMADDASYNTFLTRANQDPNSGGQVDQSSSTSQARSKFDPSSTQSSDSAVPASLRNIETPYVSETDSEFEPVFLSYASDGLPSLDQFKQVLGAKGENAGSIEELSVKEWDPKGQYNEVVERVSSAGSEQRGKRGAGKADSEEGVKVFRVESGTRVEYYVVTVGERCLLGVVAKAVES